MTTREKFLISIALLLLVVFGFSSSINYMNSRIEDATTQHNMLQTQKDEIELKLSMINQLKTTLAMNTKELNMLEMSLQDFITDEEADTYFTTLAVENDIDVYSLQISNDVTLFSDTEIDFTNIEMKEVSLSLKSSVDDFINMVDALNAREDILVTGLSYSSEQNPDAFKIVCVMFMETE